VYNDMWLLLDTSVRLLSLKASTYSKGHIQHMHWGADHHNDLIYLFIYKFKYKLN